jgi:hypothetical protein
LQAIGQTSRITEIFVGEFAKLRKAAIGFGMSVGMFQLCRQWTDFHGIWYLNTFRKPVEKIQVSLKSEENKGYFT